MKLLPGRTDHSLWSLPQTTVGINDAPPGEIGLRRGGMVFQNNRRHVCGEPVILFAEIKLHQGKARPLGQDASGNPFLHPDQEFFDFFGPVGDGKNAQQEFWSCFDQMTAIS